MSALEQQRAQMGHLGRNPFTSALQGIGASAFGGAFGLPYTQTLDWSGKGASTTVTISFGESKSHWHDIKVSLSAEEMEIERQRKRDLL